MRKNILCSGLFLLLILFVPGTPVQAQSPGSTDLKPEDVPKMIEQQKKEIENDPDMDPDQKAMLLNMLNSKTVKEASRQMEHPDSKMKEAFRLGTKMTSLPLPDRKRLATIPSRILTTPQVNQYAQNLYTKLTTALDAGAQKETGSILRQSGENSGKLNAEALVAWYNGNKAVALLLASRSVSLSADVHAINNLGAMLDLGGYEEKAVPLLQYAVHRDSTDASLWNNLGRAWLGLGEKKKAKQMFLNSVHYSPNQPEANNSLGCLYEGEGDKKQAAAHYEKSLEGAYNQNASDRLSELQPDYDLSRLIHIHYKAPKYFDQFAIEIPGECTAIDQTDSMNKIHEAFRNGLASLGNQYADMETRDQEHTDAYMKAMQKQMLDALNNGKAFVPRIGPFELLAKKMLVSLASDFMQEKQKAEKDYQVRYQALVEQYRASASVVSQKFKKLKASCVFEGEGGRNDEKEFAKYSREECEAQKKLADKLQLDAGDLHGVFKARCRRLILDYYDDQVYWIALSSTVPSLVDQQFCGAVGGYLDELSHLSLSTPFIDYGNMCETTHSDGTPAGTDDFSSRAKPACPISVNIAFLVGKISLDCTSFSISGGEGIKAGYKKDFVSGQSTLSIGAGITARVGTGRVNAGVSADESIFITFDGDGHACDAGLKMNAGASASAGPLGTGADAGYTVSMNSGFDFTHSTMNNSIDL